MTGDPDRRARGSGQGPRKWVHGEHPERFQPRPGEEPPSLSSDSRSVPDGAADPSRDSRVHQGEAGDRPDRP